MVTIPLGSRSLGATHTVRLAKPSLGRWILAVTLGEVTGFALTALVALLALRWGGHPSTIEGRLIALIVMTCAGLLEGAGLGLGQWLVLRSWLPGLRARSWLAATMLVAGGGWFVGMSMPLLAEFLGAPGATVDAAPVNAGPSGVSVLVVAALFGAVAGALFGLSQWRVLRRHAVGAGLWILANVFGWSLGLPFAYLAGMLGRGDSSPLSLFALALAAATMMGLAVALATGAVLCRIDPFAIENHAV